MMDETKRVVRSMIVLLAALLLVYVVFFDVHGDEFGGVQNTQNQLLSTNNQQLYVNNAQTSRNAESDDVYYLPEDAAAIKKQNDSILTTTDNQVVYVNETAKTQLIQSQNTTKIPTVIETPSASSGVVLPDIVEDFAGRRFYSTDFLFAQNTDTTLIGSKANPVRQQPQSISSFGVDSQGQEGENEEQRDQQDNDGVSQELGVVKWDDTWVWGKMLDLMVRLDLDDDVEYTLKDMNNTHYISLGDFDGSLVEIVSFLGGTVIDITGQITIQESHLFGEKIVKVTLPDYKNNLKELLLITFANGDTWFLQIDKDWYAVEIHREALKKKFGMVYDG